MSENALWTGLCVEYIGDDDFSEICESNDFELKKEDSDEEYYFFERNIKGQWLPYKHSIKEGFIYNLYYEYGCYDQDLDMSLKDMLKIQKKLFEKIDKFDLGELRLFSYLWYNGCDCPFKM